MIVGVIALIVVGPKDLPILMRKVGQFMARMRSMAAEFRASFDELARQSELDELRREVEALRSGVPAAGGFVADPDTRKVFDDINAGLQPGETHPQPPMDYQYPARFPTTGMTSGAMLPLETAPASETTDSAIAKAAP